MSRIWLLVIALAACGRDRFEDASNVDGIAHDEDLDGVNDPADNCPALFNELQEDRDDDGVGDVCDPRPDIAGDKLVSAGFFTDQFGDWVPNAADVWAFVDGSIEPSNPDADAVATTLSLTSALAQPTVSIVFTPIEYGSSVDNHFVEVTISYVDKSVYCRIGAGGGNLFAQLILIFGGNGPAFGLSTGIANGMPTPMQFTLDATQATCRVGPGNIANSNVTAGTGMAVITIDVRGARVGITNALVYDVP
jgi:hypothetical protein